jgi:hypothetical protein
MSIEIIRIQHTESKQCCILLTKISGLMQPRGIIVVDHETHIKPINRSFGKKFTDFGSSNM